MSDFKLTDDGKLFLQIESLKKYANMLLDYVSIIEKLATKRKYINECEIAIKSDSFDSISDEAFNNILEIQKLGREAEEKLKEMKKIQTAVTLLL